MITNDKENLKKNILFKNLGLRNTEVLSFLDQLTIKGMKNGVKREGYYFIDMDELYRFPPNANPKIIRIFGMFVNACQKKGFNYLMLKL